MTNILQCKNLIQDLYDKGVRSFVLCAGARNAAFIECFSYLKAPDSVDIHWGFEERSASFFALGRAKQTGFAAAVFTTSGTALVETHAAMIEAYYAGVPLVVVSADRPTKLWGTGAPQTIVQKDLFSNHIGSTLSWLDHEALKKAVFPAHINCSMMEPLIDEPVIAWKLNTARTITSKDLRTQNSYEAFKNLDLNILQQEHGESIKNPFFMISGLKESEASSVEFLEELDVPVYIESTAAFLKIKNRINAEAFDIEFLRKNFDSVIRIGGIPTHKVWRQLEDERRILVLNFSNSKFPGRSDSVVHSLDILASFVEQLNFDYKKEAFDRIKSRSQQIVKTLKKYPESEMSVFADIKKTISLLPETEVFLGNSLPIRLWDMVNVENNKKVFANRGANGIDGLLSTAYGLSYHLEKTLVAIVGDLSAFYDLAAPWFYNQNRKEFNIKIIIVNNGGGQIFTPLFENPKFTNPHELKFKHFAGLWGLKHKQVQKLSELPDIKKWPDIIEIQPNNEQTAAVWQEIKKLRL